MMAHRPSKMLSLVILTVVLFIAWSSWFDIDQTVRAQGQLIPGGRTQVIQVVDGGVLSEIRVQEGDTVKAGQILAVLEPDRARAAFDEAHAKHTALRVVLQRAQAEANGTTPVFGREFAGYPELVAAQNKLYTQRKQSLDDALAMQQEAMGLAKEELQMNERLFAGGDISRVEVLRARRQVSDIQSRSYADGTQVLLVSFYEACKAEQCAVDMPGAKGTGTSGGYVITGDSAVGASLSDGGKLIYAFGDTASLASLTQGAVQVQNSSQQDSPSTYMPVSHAAAVWTPLHLGLGAFGAAALLRNTDVKTVGNTVPEVGQPLALAQGLVMAGPVVSTNDLRVYLYQADEVTLIGEVTLDNTGRFEINLNGYVGVVVAKVTLTYNTATYDTWNHDLSRATIYIQQGVLVA
jgi:hypothetical protein